MFVTPPRIYQSKQFTHLAASKQFVAEASDLGGLITHQLYDDACDTGLCVESSLTANQSYWYFSNEIRSNDADNELQGWEFKPCHETLRKHPTLEGYRLTVYND